MTIRPPAPKLIYQWRCSRCNRDREYPISVLPQCCGVPMMKVGVLEDITPKKKH